MTERTEYSIMHFTRRRWAWILCGAWMVGAAGCSALHPLSGVPASYFPHEMRGDHRSGKETIDLSLLAQTPPRQYLLDAGDVLGVYIEGVLGRREEVPPVHFPVNNEFPPSLGYPVPIREDGTISLPLAGTLTVSGLTIRQVEDRIRQAYTVDQKILQPGRDRILISLQRPRTYNVLVVRQEAGGNELGQTSGSIGTLSLGVSKRGTGKMVSLLAYKNDVLHALTETGGLPGLDAENTIYVIRRRSGCGRPVPAFPVHSEPLPVTPTPVPTTAPAAAPLTVPATAGRPLSNAAVQPAGAHVQRMSGSSCAVPLQKVRQYLRSPGRLPPADVPYDISEGGAIQQIAYERPAPIPAYQGGRYAAPPWPGARGGRYAPVQQTAQGPGTNRVPARFAQVETPQTAVPAQAYPAGPMAAGQVPNAPAYPGPAVEQFPAQGTYYPGPAGMPAPAGPPYAAPAVPGGYPVPSPNPPSPAGQPWPAATYPAPPMSTSQMPVPQMPVPAGGPYPAGPQFPSPPPSGVHAQLLAQYGRNSQVIRIPVRLHPGESPQISEEDVILNDGDIVFIESRETEIFYTGGLLGGGQFVLPRDYDLDVLGAVSIAGGRQAMSGGTGFGNRIGGVSSLNQDVSVSASDVVILRQLPDGNQIPIKVDLNRAMRDPSQRIRIQPGDYIILQYKPHEAVAAFIERNILAGGIIGLAATTRGGGTSP